MTDVVVVGAGPAGAVAATVLARAGARVVLLDRARFPRHKLCGDTLNPGVIAMLARLDLGAVVHACGFRVDGMIVTGVDGTVIEGRYPRGLYGRSLLRSDLDLALVGDAVAAGVEFIDGTAVREPIVEEGPDGRRVVGVRLGANGIAREIHAPVTIGADGRRSTLAFGLGLARHPARPRRWAIGAYAEQVSGLSSFGEMHIRPGSYIGVAPLPNGLANVCLVRPVSSHDHDLRDPEGVLTAALAADPMLGDRFAKARFLSGPTVLGPLAVEAVPGTRAPDGLLLAGDAAGFVDPMTGDGLRLAIRGGELAADAARVALEHGWAGVGASLERRRFAELGSKWRFNRGLRGLVGSPGAVRAATVVASHVPFLVQALIRRASDCNLVSQQTFTTKDTKDTKSFLPSPQPPAPNS